MKLKNIKESGNNNTLIWAISNGADIKNDLSLQSLITDELFYLATIKDINFFELFRLTQIYRDRIRVIDESSSATPDNHELMKLFNGNYIDISENHQSMIQLHKLVENCSEKFISLAKQMTVDDDIISTEIVRMFLPMISRKFTIQIPISFDDFINSMSEDESNQIYNNNYPNTLNIITENENHGVERALMLAIVRGTSIIRYNQQYEKYVKIIKYNALKTSNDNLYKIALLGFFKKDNITKEEIHINFFNMNKNLINSTLENMSKINAPLELEFAIQLPIQYMQMLENFFSDSVLPIAYESSMSDIMSNGLNYKNFIISEYDEESGEFIKHNNSIETYKVRISELNQTLLNTINILLKSEGDIDVTSVFALLPSIYTTKAVIRINMDNINKLISHYDPTIKNMFNDIIEIANSVLNDIEKFK